MWGDLGFLLGRMMSASFDGDLCGSQGAHGDRLFDPSEFR